MIDLATVRDGLPSAVTRAYFNAGTFGPLPTAAVAAMRRHLDDAYLFGRVGSRGYATSGSLNSAAREAFGRIAGSDASRIALTHCTTDGVNLVVFGLDWQPGDEVITTTHEHPGLTEPLAVIAERRGVVVRMVEPRVDAIMAVLTARTRMVAISHVLWTTGEVLAVDRIAQEAHQAGAVVLVDGAQSGGAIPIDPAALGVDYYTFSGQKWLLGPSGTGALWVREGSLQPLSTAWPWYQSRQRRPGGPPRDWPDARRLDAGTITTTALAGISAAIDWRVQVGLDAGYARAAELAATLRDALRAAASVDVVEVETPSTIVSFRVPGREPAAVVAAAEQQGVLVRFIPGFDVVRASVAFYNDQHDLDRLVRVVT